LFATNQAVKLDEKGSDCGSKAYREVTVTKKNKGKLLKRYWLNGNKLQLLNKEDLDKLVGKTIKIRSPLYCCASGGKICNKCAGELPYLLGTKNVGLTSSAIGSELLNKLMKSFHDLTSSITAVSLDKMYIE
jgi:hypothetical protein